MRRFVPRGNDSVICSVPGSCFVPHSDVNIIAAVSLPSVAPVSRSQARGARRIFIGDAARQQVFCSPGGGVSEEAHCLADATPLYIFLPVHELERIQWKQRAH